MFISCPHCRELVAIDRETRLAPEMCPRCGGVLRGNAATGTAATDVSAADGRSFVSFLQNDETAELPATEAMDTIGVETIDEETIAVPTSLEDASEGSAVTEPDAAAVDKANPGTDPQAIGAAESNTVAASVISTPIVSAPAPSAQALPPTPSFTRQIAQPGVHPRTAKWQWAMLIALSLALALQVLLADRVRLATDATWRP
jgi:hypothetical protein